MPHRVTSPVGGKPTWGPDPAHPSVASRDSCVLAHPSLHPLLLPAAYSLCRSHSPSRTFEGSLPSQGPRSLAAAAILETFLSSWHFSQGCCSLGTEGRAKRRGPREPQSCGHQCDSDRGWHGIKDLLCHALLSSQSPILHTDTLH